METKTTLSQLIESCGEDFLSLEKGLYGFNNMYKWEATKKTWCCDEHGESRKYGYGIIPEEALKDLLKK